MVRHSYPSDVIRRCLRSGSSDRAERLIDKLPLSNLSPVVEELTPLEARALFDIVFTPDRVERTLLELPRRDLAAIVAGVDDTRLVRLLSRLAGPKAARLMAVLPPERRKATKQLLDGYARSFTLAVRPVSSVMQPVKYPLSPEMTVGEALGSLTVPSPPATLYVVDRDGHLLGRVSSAQLSALEPGRRLGEVMEPLSLAVRSSTPVHEVAALLQQGRSDLPVSDRDGRVVGEVHADAIFPLVASREGDEVPRPDGRRILRRFLPWFTASLLLAASAAGWMSGVLHF